MMHNTEVLRMLDRATTVLVAEAKGGASGKKSAETLLIELNQSYEKLGGIVMQIGSGLSAIPETIDETIGKIHTEVAGQCKALKELKPSDSRSLLMLEAITVAFFKIKYLAKNEDKVTQPLKTKTAEIASTMLETLKSLHPSSEILKGIEAQEREVKKKEQPSCTIS